MLMEIVFANQHQIVFQEAITFSILFILLVVCSRKQFPKTFLIFDVFVWLHWQKSASVTTTLVTHISDNQHCNGGPVSNGNLGNKSDVQTCGEDCVTLFGSQIKFITFRKSNINNQWTLFLRIDGGLCFKNKSKSRFYLFCVLYVHKV